MGPTSSQTVDTMKRKDSATPTSSNLISNTIKNLLAKPVASLTAENPKSVSPCV